MNCLKCKRETEGTNVFCQDCLQIMENYPVKPGTPVYLPRRPNRNVEKSQPRRRPEDIILRMQKAVRWLTLVIGVLSLLLCMLAAMLLNTLNQEVQETNIGRNYTTNTSQQP